VDLDESDLIAMLLALRNSQRDPEAQLAGS
jgi:hypothetical protein